MMRMTLDDQLPVDQASAGTGLKTRGGARIGLLCLVVLFSFLARAAITSGQVTDVPAFELATPVAESLQDFDPGDDKLESTPTPDPEIALAATASLTESTTLAGTLQVELKGSSVTVTDVRIKLGEHNAPLSIDLIGQALPLSLVGGTVQYSWSLTIDPEAGIETERVVIVLRVAELTGDAAAAEQADDDRPGWISVEASVDQAATPVYETGYEFPLDNPEQPSKTTELDEATPTVEMDPTDDQTPLEQLPEEPGPTSLPAAAPFDDLVNDACERTHSTSPDGTSSVIAEPASDDGASSEAIDAEADILALDPMTSPTPGASQLLRFTLHNTTDRTVNYWIRAAISGADWQVTLINQNGEESVERVVDLGADGVMLILVKVVVPPDAYTSQQATVSLDVEQISVDELQSVRLESNARQQPSEQEALQFCHLPDA